MKNSGLLASSSFPHLGVLENLQFNEAITNQAGPDKEESNYDTETSTECFQSFGGYGMPPEKIEKTA